MPFGARQAFTSADSPEAIIDKVQKANQNHLLKSSTRRGLVRVENILSGIDSVLDPIAIAIQHDPHISALIVGATRWVVTIGLRYLAYFEAIVSALEMVTEHLSFLWKYAVRLFSDSPDVQAVLTITYRDVIDLCVTVRSVFYDDLGHMKATSFRLLSRVLWSSADKKIDAIRKRFEQHTKLVMREAKAVMYEKDLEEMARNHEQKLAVQAKADEEAESRRLQKRRNTILWVSDFEYSGTQVETLRTRFGQSGTWLLQRIEFRQWIDDADSSLLWCYGSPGAGKTVLASIVQNLISTRFAHDPQVGCSFVYCSYRDLQKPEAYIFSFLRQLLAQLPNLPAGVEDQFDLLYPDGKKLLTDDIKLPIDDHEKSEPHELFTYVLEKFCKVHLLFDALDECEGRNQWLVPFLCNLVR